MFQLYSTDTTNIFEKDLVHNFAKLGYRELGSEADGGQDFSVEYIISSALLGEDKRRIAAVPVLLAKNKIDYPLLVFLSQKYGFAEKLLGALVALIKAAPTRDIERAVAAMSGGGVIPAKIDEAHVKQALRLYGIRGR